MKKTYQELEKEIEALRTTNNLIENSSVIRIIWKAFSEWGVEFVTENIENVFGYSADEFLTESVKYSDVIHNDDFQTVKGALLGKDSDGSIFIEHKPYRIIAKDGSIKWLKDITSIHRNNIGEITHYEGVIIDITQQKEAEEAIEDNELRWQFAIEGNSDGLWDWNLLTDEVYYSAQWKKMLGFSDDEIKGGLDEWDNRVHPDDKQKALEDIDLHLRGETDFYVNEHRLLCKNNTYKWILDRGKVITFSKDNKPTRMIGTLSDITKRKKAEAESKLRENYLLALNKAKEVLLNTDVDKALQRTVDVLGPVSKASRTYIFINHKNENNELLMSQKAEHCAIGIKSEIDNPQLQGLSYSFFERMKDVLSKGNVYKGNVKEFAKDERDFLESQGIKTILIIPLIIGDEFIGFIGFDNCDSEREWDIAEQNFLKVAAGDLSQFIERNKTQEQLRIEFQRFEKTLDALDAVVYVSDIKTHELLFLNELGKKKSGGKIGEKCYFALQKGQTEPCDFCTNHLLIDEKGNPKEPHIWEFQNTITNRWYQCRDQAIKWTDGRLVRIEVATDITKQKLIEQELEVEHRRLKNIMDANPAGIYIVDKDCNIEYVNPIIEKEFGKPDGIKCHSYFHGIPKPCKWCKNDKVFNGESVRWEWFSKRNRKHYDLLDMPITNLNGSVSKFEVLFDITDRKNAEQELRDSELKFRTLVDNMSDLVFVVDSDLRIITINETARTLVNRKTEDIIGKRVSDLFPPRIFKDYNEKLKEAFVIRKQIKIDSELEIGITKLYISTDMNPVFDKKGKMVAVMGVSRDITERKVAEQTLLKSEARLIESNKTKDKFFAIIAHDLRSPFNSMLGFSDLLYNNFNEYNTEKQKNMIDILHNSINSTYKLLDNLLLWSQSQRGIIELKKELFNLEQLINEATNLLQQSADDKAITITNSIPLDIRIAVDKQMFATIIRNLISNAIKYTNRKGLIEVKTEMYNENKEEYIKISVSDNGVGITPEAQAMLFDINESASTKGTENETGTGLGLVLCKDFVEMHNGKIWVESEIGKGSSFTFTIPSKLISSTENEENVVKKKENFVFLVVEDEEINFMFLKILLNNHNLDIEIVRAVNGKEAVDICKNNSDICFVLMDLKMPVMDGFEATSLIKKFRPELPIIAQTAYTTKKDKQKADLAGCDGFISKPISKKALKGVIDKCLIL